MRYKERIPIFLELVNLDKLFSKFSLVEQDDVDKAIYLIYENLDNIKEYWMENSKLTFFEVLNKYRIIPYNPHMMVINEAHILKSQNTKLVDYALVEVDFDENLKVLPKKEVKLLKTLSDKQLSKIVREYFHPRDRIVREVSRLLLKERGAI